MPASRRPLLYVGAAACLIAGGAFSGNLLSAGAATKAKAAATATPGATGAFKSNEDPAHEAAESPEREAAEANGTAGFGHEHGGRRGPGPGGSNEDPAHEAAESPEREAQENAEANGQSTAPAAPTPSSTSSAQ